VRTGSPAREHERTASRTPPALRAGAASDGASDIDIRGPAERPKDGASSNFEVRRTRGGPPRACKWFRTDARTPPTVCFPQTSFPADLLSADQPGFVFLGGILIAVARLAAILLVD